jgi:capsular polysaccharide biosynthesis protein
VSNIFFRKRVFCLTSVTALAVLGSGLSAVAQTVPAVQQSTQLSTTEVSVDQTSAGVETQSQNFSTVSEGNPVFVSDSTTSQQFSGISTEETANPANRIVTACSWNNVNLICGTSCPVPRSAISSVCA